MDLLSTSSLLILGSIAAFSILWMVRSIPALCPTFSLRGSQDFQKETEVSRGVTQDESQQNHNHPALKILYEPDPSGRRDMMAEVNIIAVHGLGANVDWSWVCKKGPKHVHWLKDPDMLPAKVPKSKIMTYSYESRWHRDAPRIRLELCGEELVKSLYAFRDEIGDRPIVFIGHSLGGLVILHGLLSANRNERSKYLAAQTVGFLALGTPFRGSKMYRLADVTAKIMSLASSHRGIIRDLEPDDERLRDQVHAFGELREELQIPTACFVELRPSDYGKRAGFSLPYFKGRVVEEESAHIPGWGRFPLDKDHFGLNKYPGPEDRSFLAVSSQISEMCNNANQLLERRQPTLPQRHFMVPFGRNEDFVGRKLTLQQVLKRCPPDTFKDSCQLTIIEGLGGIGKTQIALETAYRIRYTYPNCSIFWVPAIDANSFENAYRDIGRLLGTPGIDDKEANIKALVNEALNKESVGEWLLIIDNADDLRLLFSQKAIFDHLPRSPKGSILVTTRNRAVAMQFGVSGQNIITVKEMSRVESRQLLGKNLHTEQTQDTDGMNSLLRFLCDLPLAIKQASAYMTAQSMTITRYLDLCQSSDKTLVILLSKEFEDHGRYRNIRNPVATTWLISFQYISRDVPLAAEYLGFISFLAEKNIPRSLLPQRENELEVDEAIGTLKAYAFISEREDRKSFDIHRLVRIAMRHWSKDKPERVIWATQAIQQLAKIYPSPHHENREIWLDYLPHALSALESRGIMTDQKAVPHLLFNVAESNAKLAKYAEAEQMHRETLDLRETVLGREHPDTLTSINNLASVLERQGKYEEAEQMHQEALGLRETVLGREHPDTLSSMNDLALLLESQGKYEEAETFHRHAQGLREVVLGREHPDTLSSMSNLALVLERQGKYEESEQINQEAVVLCEKVLGQEHPTTLTSMNNLALVFESQGKYEKAEQLHRETLGLRGKVLGREHPDTLSSANNLALLLRNRGKYEEAEQIHRETLRLREKVLGREHPDTLSSRNNLALVLEKLGKTVEAEQIHREVLGLCEKVLGREHPFTLSGMNNLALVLRNQGKYSEAEQIHREELGLCEKVMGRDHPDRLISMNNLALVLERQARYMEAEQIHREVFGLFGKVLGREHPLVLTNLNNLALVLEKQSKYEVAEQMHREALRLREKVLGREHPDTLTSMNNLASVLERQGKPVDIEANKELEKLTS